MLTLPSDPSHRDGGILKMVHCKLYTNFDTLGIDYPQEHTVSNNRQGDNHIQLFPAGIFHCLQSRSGTTYYMLSTLTMTEGTAGKKERHGV